MRPLLLIAIGGALGALSRYWMSNFINQVLPSKVHMGTLLVNILGSFLIGAMYVLIIEKFAIHSEWRSVLVVGFLGAFTTFSTFSLESMNYLENGHFGLAGLYIVLSVVCCILACAGGMWLTRTL